MTDTATGMARAADDWTAGVPRLLYDRCPACAHLWYLRRPTCPQCGHAPPERTEAGGLGTVAARTVVRRAPTAALRDLVPYAILLVDAAEGFRFMAHGTEDLVIGDSTRTGFAAFDGGIVPFCRPA